MKKRIRVNEWKALSCRFFVGLVTNYCRLLLKRVGFPIQLNQGHFDHAGVNSNEENVAYSDPAFGNF